ncbi:MAG: pseudouridine synthase [Gammaproteobacteria bacterium]|nr:pseudouridine synthase [Gammaproteobacteria bacterium]MDP2140700.1 pseudouridine synthase [Gammaproteobacteria bacterium]MDP2346956.1 pseudouridine synthase [Gammaproteobacteria bacterium]
MASGSHRLDRHLSSTLGINRRNIKPLLAQGLISVDDKIACAADQLVNQFSRIVVDDMELPSMTATYLQMHKAVGLLSATKDAQYPTVIDQIDHPAKLELHIVGRLDRNSSGLLLLTNDGNWSQAMMAPENCVEKVYRVELAKPVTPDCIDAFASGMHFPFEDITTLPAKLEVLDERVAQVTLVEGRYHQIKRMFGRFRNPVVGLHRIAIGPLLLDPTLEPGQWRELSASERAEAVSEH